MTPTSGCCLRAMHPCRLAAKNLSELLQAGNVKTQAAMAWNYVACRTPTSWWWDKAPAAGGVGAFSTLQVAGPLLFVVFLSPSPEQNLFPSSFFSCFPTRATLLHPDCRTHKFVHVVGAIIEIKLQKCRFSLQYFYLASVGPMDTYPHLAHLILM